MNTRYRLPFHDALVAELRSRDPDSWNWFAQNLETQEHRDSQLTEFLKGNARISEGSSPELELALNTAREALSEHRPTLLYRVIGDIRPNAGIFLQSDQLHITVSGNLESLLAADELLALMGHELGHARLLEEGSCELAIADQLLEARTTQSDSPVWHETQRRLSLMNEVACDRVGLQVTQSLEATVGMLLKIATGSPKISATDFLQQAEEIFEREGGWKGQVGSQGFSHPEEHIRVLALRWWELRSLEAETEIQRLIDGRSDLTRMTLLDQTRWQQWSEQLIRNILAPAWRATEASQAHARLFVPSLPTQGAIRPQMSLEQLRSDLEFAGRELRDYACFLLLDFATCDPSLEDLALSQAIQLARAIDVEERLLELMKNELKLRKRQLDALGKKASTLLEAAAKQMPVASEATLVVEELNDSPEADSDSGEST